MRAGQPNGSVRERYDACLRALGTVPLVLRSPRRGLHLYVPLAEPMSTLGLTHTYQPGLPVLVPHVLGAEGLEVLRCYQQPDEATMFNVVMSGHELRERRA